MQSQQRPALAGNYIAGGSSPSSSHPQHVNHLLVSLNNTVAYRARLDSGSYVSLAELCGVPFAPDKFAVVVDVLTKLLGELSSNSTLRPQMTIADVRRVMGAVTDELMQTLRDVEHFSDERAQSAAAGSLAGLERLQKHMDAHWFAESDCSWTGLEVSPDVGWEMLSFVHRCSSAAGLWRECVINYSRMKALSRLLSSTPGRQDLPGHCILAISSCQKEHAFENALLMFHSLLADFSGQLDSRILSEALTSLAHCVRNGSDLVTVRSLFVDDGAASAVPVGVELYSAIIAGCARAAADDPSVMTVALSLYRSLKDNELQPSAETYSQLVAVAAACGEPSQAFAFFTEARSICGVQSLPPSLYANLLQAYVNARYFRDAMLTLSVLCEAGAPLNRAAFHNVLSGAKTPRDASEVVALMSGPKFNIKPTVATFGLMLVAESRMRRGIDTLLGAYDLWSNVLAIAGQSCAHGDDVERWLSDHEPATVQALEHCLLNTRVDVTERTRKYVLPLLRAPQLNMTNYLGSFPPQCPTTVPQGSYIAVLAADVLNNVETLFGPIAHHFAAIIVPYSQLVLFRRAKLDLSQETIEEWKSARQLKLQRFLLHHQSRVHVMSLEEELRQSADAQRYGVQVGDLAGRAAAVAVNLARGLQSGTEVYATSRSVMYLVTTSFSRCGRFIIDNPECRRIVRLHNPLTAPNWSPMHQCEVEPSDNPSAACSVDQLKGSDDATIDHVEDGTGAEILMELLRE